ncbi:hypothetical protein NDA16_001589 [Ustilago loliicola]|nr:hypothetical protein NDA16_001589 [Ustilago loliicola]
MNDSLGALLAIVILWSILRFAFGGGSNNNTNGGHQTPALNTARTRQVPQHMVDSVKTLFPHISDASIRYDLQRSGSVEATCERILNEGGLPSPPAGFFGTAEPSTPSNAATLRAQNANRTPNGAASGSASSVSTPSKSPNLISRYGLQSRIAGSDDLPSTPNSHTSNSSHGSPSSWATTPEERAKLLKDRKEQMILEARRKLLERQQNAAKDSNTAAKTSSLPSAAPPGTVLKGVSIYKDKADPVALQDNEYPPWLFKLLDDPSIASSSSLASIEMAGMSKGEARAAQKRQSKVLRAAQLAKEKAKAKAAERAAKTASTETAKDTTAEKEVTLTSEQQRANEMAKAVQDEQARRKMLRKENKEAIKARNFVSAS